MTHSNEILKIVRDKIVKVKIEKGLTIKLLRMNLLLQEIWQRHFLKAMKI